MLQPKKTKFRKPSRAASTAREGRHGPELRPVRPEGDGARAVTARQIEAARRAITRAMKRAGRVWIRIFPDVPVSSKPTEVPYGLGQGRARVLGRRVKPGRIMFEIDGVPRSSGG
jgi:large subunit ribosomal protein L16